MAITLMADHEYAAEYLANGTVKVQGFDVEAAWPEGGAGAAYPSFFTEPAYDMMVVPITNYLIARDIGRPVMGLPVFPDVSFAHVGAQVNVNAGISGPKDLEGKRVGVRGWGFNPGTWVRGALADVYGLDLTKVHWVEAEPNSLMRVDYPRDPRFSISKGGDQVAELESGELDAVLFDRSGPPLGGNRARLFADPLDAALTYHRQSGIFPVNIMLVAKQDVLDANPGLAQAVVDACDEARRLYYDNVSDDDEHMGLPIGWLREHSLFPHENGLESNRRAIETIVRYAADLGIISRRFAPEELFFDGAR
ncbi:MAG: hypothetical protein F4185_05410 [Chloroflexi bacterium]|nr:hypothetical protein [Chloroflexota bacterium]MYF65344.1 hypothetical protein [Chloroflexota bacterium]MYK33533.1 hypothetical protein [Chloroflexota bacterium]